MSEPKNIHELADMFVKLADFAKEQGWTTDAPEKAVRLAEIWFAPPRFGDTDEIANHRMLNLDNVVAIIEDHYKLRTS